MSQPDPLVEILRIFYRRGLAIANSQPAADEGETVKNTNAPDQGRLCDDGANGNSRNAPASKDKTNASTKP
jgi:hypothetical protein